MTPKQPLEEIFTKENINECARKSNEEQRKVCGLETLTISKIMEKFDDRWFAATEGRNDLRRVVFKISIRKVLEKIVPPKVENEREFFGKIFGKAVSEQQALDWKIGFNIAVDIANSNIKKVL